MPHHPDNITPTTLADYLEAMSRAVFTSGISWEVIRAKWPGIREAFDEFDPEKVAAYTPVDVERLLGDTRIIRNRKKVEAIVANAGELIVTERDFGSMPAYLGSFPDNDALVKDLHKRFAFLGPSVAHFFLFGIEWDMPAQEAWARQRFTEGNYHSRR